MLLKRAAREYGIMRTFTGESLNYSSATATVDGVAMKITINILWLVVPAVLGFALLIFSEHQQHVPDFLPFLILLACPLMHVFMHHGHGQSSHDRRPS